MKIIRAWEDPIYEQIQIATELLDWVNRIDAIKQNDEEILLD